MEKKDTSEENIIKFIRQKDYVMVNDNLGKGSFGKTAILKDPFINELFVAKKYEPHPSIKNDPQLEEHFFENFLQEIKILHKLNHKNIVRIYNYYAYENQKTAYIIMEYIEGVSIDKFISEKVNTSEQLDSIFIQLIDGFSYIEEHGIIHRDIRETNILINTSEIVKIIDFGIGKIIKNSNKTEDSLRTDINRAGINLLPQEYYEKVYTSKTDMFYLAELFHRLINNTDSVQKDQFSYNNILNKMMKKNPIDRYDSFSEVKQSIDRLDFINIPVSPQDKRIYQEFSQSLFEILFNFSGPRKFVTDPKLFILSLEKVLKDNIFEDFIQNPSDLLETVVLEGYRYNQFGVSVRIVEEFLSWFKSAKKDSQKLILNNIILKLSTKDIIYFDDNDELPF